MDNEVDCAKWMPSFKKSARIGRVPVRDPEAATISASHDERAAVGCFLEAQKIAAWPYINT
eukprot:5491379-Pleurochrysis_carterae.AAC.2